MDLSCLKTPKISAASPLSAKISMMLSQKANNRISSFHSWFSAVSNRYELTMVDHRSTNFPAEVIPALKKTPRIARPKGFLRANPCGSAHRHAGEKLQ
jgi:hypothetical protein